MAHSLPYGHVGVFELNVLAHQGDAYRRAPGALGGHKTFPNGPIGPMARFEPQPAQDKFPPGFARPAEGHPVPLGAAGAAMWGSQVTWIWSVFSRPRSARIWGGASRNGSDSMSPTVPPTSTRTISACVSRGTRQLRCLLARV